MFYGLSDIGLVREENQDSFISVANTQGEMLYLVCDGIGGGKSGNVASNLAASFLAEKFASQNSFKTLTDAKTWMTQMLYKTNDHVFSFSTTGKSMTGMGTTLVGAYIGKQGSFVVNIGDSRAYIVDQEDQLRCLTVDHNLAYDLYLSGEINDEERINHPQRNVLTNAIGIVGELRVDVFDVPETSQLLLLSSDGLHGYVSEEKIQEVLTKYHTSVQEKAQQLVDLANKAGGYDNVTVLLVTLNSEDEVI